MKIEYIRGDLLNSDEKVIMHDCNDQGIIGSGIALAIKHKWPHVFNDYVEWHLTGRMKMGLFQVSHPREDNQPQIINAITQTLNRQRNVSYKAMHQIFSALNYFVDPDNGKIFTRVAMPLIGAVRGGGKWPKIAGIIEEQARTYQPVVYVYDVEPEGVHVP